MTFFQIINYGFNAWLKKKKKDSIQEEGEYHQKKCICTMCCQNIIEKGIKHIVNVVTLQRWQRFNLISVFLLRQKIISKASQKSRRKILHPSWSMQILWVRLLVWMCTACSCVCIGSSCSISHETGDVMVLGLFCLLLSIINNFDCGGWTLLSFNLPGISFFLEALKNP